MRKMQFVMAAALLAILMACTLHAREDMVPDTKLTYKTIGKTKLQLHVFSPDDHKATDKKPAIVFFFGGGWMGGTPRQFYQQARAFAELGFLKP